MMNNLDIAGTVEATRVFVTTVPYCADEELKM
jgi:hypothetical protein